MNTGILLTARLKSKRLKKKALLKIDGQSIIEIQLKHLRKIRNIDKIVIITSQYKLDDEIASIALRNNVSIYRGEPINVLRRIYKAALKFKFKYILSFTADNPLICPISAERQLKESIKNNYDFSKISNLPIGTHGYFLRFEALKKAIKITKSKDTENWTQVFENNEDIFRNGQYAFDVPEFYSNARFTIDYYNDYKFIKKLILSSDVNFDLKNYHKHLTKYLELNKKILSINKNMIQRKIKKINL